MTTATATDTNHRRQRRILRLLIEPTQFDLMTGAELADWDRKADEGWNTLVDWLRESDSATTQYTGQEATQ
jgi:hypothetical protein